MCDRLKIEAVVVKHLAAMRDELRGVVPMLDVVLEMELDRASDWLNFRYVVYKWEDVISSVDEDDAPVLIEETVGFPYMTNEA